MGLPHKLHVTRWTEPQAQCQTHEEAQDLAESQVGSPEALEQGLSVSQNFINSVTQTLSTFSPGLEEKLRPETTVTAYCL